MAAVSSARAVRPPRAMLWVLLLASAATVVLVGLAGTVLLLRAIDSSVASPRTLGRPFLWASVLTIASLSLRTLRWIFLLRRAETRIPIRDAYIGYLAGFSLVLVPLLIGEIAVRAVVHKRRGRVPIATTIVTNLWERGLDFTALAILGGVAGLLLTGPAPWTVAMLAAAGLTLIPAIRRQMLALLTRTAAIATSGEAPRCERLARTTTWLTALAASLVAWLLPAGALWMLANAFAPFGTVNAVRAYAVSSTVSGLALMPGGVLITGQQLLGALAAHGFSESASVMTVAAARLATIGVSLVLGAIFLLAHWRTLPASSESHFDDIADAYDVQIPESRRHALLERKTALMRGVLERERVGLRGLDVGCGQGAYVARMRQLGFDVHGIDASAGQVRLAARNVGRDDLVRVGSVLSIPAAGESFDFLYIINVLHHVGAIEEQRRAFAELLRVLKPGGLLFVHEINTRNILFRFYMGYVFPSLNCIDEGIEHWILPQRLDDYVKADLVDVQYFTFLPDFVPRALVSLLAPFERWLERSGLRTYSAHYMAVLRKRS